MRVRPSRSMLVWMRSSMMPLPLTRAKDSSLALCIVQLSRCHRDCTRSLHEFRQQFMKHILATPTPHNINRPRLSRHNALSMPVGPCFPRGPQASGSDKTQPTKPKCGSPNERLEPKSQRSDSELPVRGCERSESRPCRPNLKIPPGHRTWW